ncbi:unnamed protein product [Closterium sp. NIES-65]|nr:unnamed protein product [Closterium sp. NIES-65]
MGGGMMRFKRSHMRTMRCPPVATTSIATIAACHPLPPALRSKSVSDPGGAGTGEKDGKKDDGNGSWRGETVGVDMGVGGRGAEEWGQRRQGKGDGRTGEVPGGEGANGEKNASSAAAVA